MKIFSVSRLLLVLTLATGCTFERTSERLSPTAPTANESTAAGPPIGSSSTGRGSTSAGASGFSGAWGSSTIAGLPLGNCSDVNWQINSQTDTSITGTVSANCSSGVVVAANLTGALQGADAINVTAEGTLTMLGLPCQFKLTGVGRRQGGDAIKVDYNGTYCFGPVSGSEMLRRPGTKASLYSSH
jgi:hypothetical protein